MKTKKTDPEWLWGSVHALIDSENVGPSIFNVLTRTPNSMLGNVADEISSQALAIK